MDIDYENMYDLTHLSREDKLKIVKIEIQKIIDINDLLFNALQFNKYDECAEAYIYASRLIGDASCNIRKMFKY